MCVCVLEEKGGGGVCSAGEYIFSISFVKIIVAKIYACGIVIIPSFSSYCVFSCICRLGDVLSSLTSKKDVVPYENSLLTQILGDSIGIGLSLYM